MGKKDYNFNRFWEDLNNGFEIYYSYMGCRYLISKIAKNCYRNELVEAPSKCPHQKTSMITLKRVKEIYEHMDNLEYKSI